MSAVIAGVVGALTWSLAEYLLHRFAGHYPKGKVAFSREHLAHHTDPTYFTPTPKKARTAAVITAVAGTPVALALGPLHGLVAIGGFLAAYIGYELVHRRIHTHRPLGPYGRLIRRHHLYHHFGAPKMNHGVTSPIWDMVFGTYVRPERVRVPVKHALRWMVDERGDLLPAFARDYELGRRRRARA